MKVSEVLRMLYDDGWFLCAAGKSSTAQAFDKIRRVTVAGKPSDDLAPGTLKSILRQSGLKQF